jgi:hypothetical protein
MTRRPAIDPVKSTVAEAPAATAAEQKAAAAVALRDDEIIQLSIRPSPWSILVNSCKLIIAMMLLAAALVIYSQGQPALGASIALLGTLLVAFSGVLIATLQWATHLYVLTNRRVMRFGGIFSVSVVELGLTQVGDAQVRPAWYRPWLHMASIGIVPRGDGQGEMLWEHVARPDEVQEILIRAIRRANMK